MAKTHTELKTTLDWAMEYVKRAWPVLPCYRVRPNGDCMCPSKSSERKKTKDGSCKTPGKHPVPRLVPRGSLDASTDSNKIKKWFGNNGEYNIAVATGKNRQGNLMVVDLDVRKGKDGPATWEALKAEIGPFADTLWQTTGSGGRQLFWRTEEEVPMSQETKLGPGIDVRGKSGYIVVPPSVNDLGAYKWENWGPPHTVQTAPEPLEDRARKGRAAPSRAAAVTARAAKPKPNAEQKDDPNERLTLAQVSELLNMIPPDQRDFWMLFGHVLKTIADWIGGEQKAFEVWDQWAQKGDGYGGLKDQQTQWDSFTHSTEHPIALLKKHARANGWAPSEEFRREGNKWRREAARTMLDALSVTASPDDIDPLLAILAGLPEHHRDPFYKDIKEKCGMNIVGLRKAVAKLQTHFLESEEGESDYGVIVAKRVLESHFKNGKHLIHAADGFFWKYNGRYWEQIVTDKEIGNLCVAAALELGPIPKDVDTVVRQAINILANLQARGGDPLRLAQPPLPVVNCLNGELWITEDFTVELRDHNPDSFLRFGLDITYDPSATCPIFDKAVLEVFQDSPDPEDMRRHMMEIYGYAIQPRRFIKIFLLWRGGGDNGKSKLVEVLIELIGKNAVAPGRIEKLGKSEYHQANLKSKLLFRDDDVEHNTVLPDGILKQYSEAKYSNGRDPYGRVSEFVVCILPILLCNDYPITKDLSQGTLKRAHVVPFRHEFTEGVDLDATLFERIIKDELAGILNRAIEGLQRLMVRKHFLEPNDCLIAKDEFLKESNPLPRFLDSGWCVRTLAEEITAVTSLIGLDIEIAKEGRNQAMVETLQREIAVTTAKAETEGIEGICQTTQEFYNNFIVWCRNEGNNWKPKKSEVERDLANLKFPVSNKSGQLTVYRLRSRKVHDQTPERPM